MPDMGGWEWVILAIVALVLFGGTKLANVGKNAGKAIREFKEETSGLKASSDSTPAAVEPAPVQPAPVQPVQTAQAEVPVAQPAPVIPPAQDAGPAHS